MGREKLMRKYGCEVLKNLDDAMTPEEIRKAIEDGVIEAKDHAACPFSCPWRIWKYIENLEDPHILLRTLVEMGEKKLRQENKRKAKLVLKVIESKEVREEQRIS